MYPIVEYGHGEFEVLLTPTEWVKVHAPQKFLQLSVDPHTSWNLLIYYLTLVVVNFQVELLLLFLLHSKGSCIFFLPPSIVNIAVVDVVFVTYQVELLLFLLPPNLV